MGKNVAVFVDVANIFYAAKAAGVDIDYVTLLKASSAGRDLVRAYAYTGLDPDNENQRNFHDFLRRSGYKVVSKDIRKYGDGKVKANLDIELVVDMMKTARNLDIAIVVSGDGDFAPAIRAVQEQGVRVEVVSFRGNTSSDLMDVADQFTDITQVAKVEKGSSRSGRRVAADDDLSMTEVPDKQSEGTGERTRGGRGRTRRTVATPTTATRGRSRSTAAPARVARDDAAEPRDASDAPIVVLPGEKLSRAAARPAALAEDLDQDADDVFDGDAAEDGDDEGVAGSASENGELAENGELGEDGLPRRRRRRGGRGRGRGRGRDGAAEDGQYAPTADRAPAADRAAGGDRAAAAIASLRPIAEDDEEVAPRTTRRSASTFGSVWDSQIGAPTNTRREPIVDDDEDLDEPAIPEYLLTERRQRDANRGRGGARARTWRRLRGRARPGALRRRTWQHALPLRAAGSCPRGQLQPAGPRPGWPRPTADGPRGRSQPAGLPRSAATRASRLGRRAVERGPAGDRGDASGPDGLAAARVPATGAVRAACRARADRRFGGRRRRPGDRRGRARSQDPDAPHRGPDRGCGGGGWRDRRGRAGHQGHAEPDSQAGRRRRDRRGADGRLGDADEWLDPDAEHPRHDVGAHDDPAHQLDRNRGRRCDRDGRRGRRGCRGPEAPGHAPQGRARRLIATGGFRTRGQPAAVAAALAMLRGGMPHGVLVTGPVGVGKTTFADDLAAGLLCRNEDPDVRPCRACRGCRALEHGNHPDVHRLAPAGAGFVIPIGGREERGVRDLVRDLALLPVEGGARVAVITSADRMTEDAQSAFLKTLEEPPGRDGPDPHGGRRGTPAADDPLALRPDQAGARLAPGRRSRSSLTRGSSMRPRPRAWPALPAAGPAKQWRSLAPRSR